MINRQLVCIFRRSLSATVNVIIRLAMFSVKKKRINLLRSQWGKPVDKYRNFDLITSYHAMAAESGNGPFVDSRTWNDLDFDTIFTLMDRNISGIGQQFLYHLMHRYERDEAALQARFRTITRLRNDRNLREQIQLGLFGLSSVSSYFIASLVSGKPIPFSKYYPLFYICPILFVASVCLMVSHGVFLLAAAAIAIANIILNKLFSRTIYDYFAGFSGLNALIGAALSIGAITPDSSIAEIEALKHRRGILKSLEKKLGYFVMDKDALPEMVALGIEYLNMFLLFDIIAYYRSVDTLRKHREDIAAVFESVASLDASISIASYLEGIPVHTTPTFHNGGIGFQELSHPLIPSAVPNTLETLSESMLITGSNMSGKTSFIKTIGINVILAQTVYVCLARSISIPRLVVKSSITRNEDLTEGKSYFFAEIEALHTFMQLSEQSDAYLFLIDEIFRGTNTIERLASSAAVLKYLDRRNTVFVTTHDIELQELLEGRFRMFHFSEQVEEGKFFFNYKIKEGPCTSGNAIRLLEIMEYPASAVAEATSIVRALLESGSAPGRRTSPDGSV